MTRIERLVPNIITINQMLSSLKGSKELFNNFLKTIEEKNIKKNIATYTIIIDHYFHHKENINMCEIIKIVINDFKILKDIKFYNNIFSKFLKIDDLDNFEFYFKKFIKIINKNIKNNNNIEIINKNTENKKMKIKKHKILNMNERTFSIIFQYYLRKKNYNEFHTYYQKMKNEIPKMVNIKIYSIIFNDFFLKNKFCDNFQKDFIYFFNDLLYFIHLNALKVDNILISILLRVNNNKAFFCKENFLKIFDLIQTQNFVIDNKTFQILKNNPISNDLYKTL
jgi:hypothetical protein